MQIAEVNKTPKVRAQAFKNGEIHDWYRTVWGYSDHLVADLLQEFGAGPKARILDPFCGTGTTLVECSKRGIRSAGIDANPVSCFAARVKTTWALSPKRLMELADELSLLRGTLTRGCSTDPTYQYIQSTGMLARGWICDKPLRKAVNIKRAIANLATTSKYKHALTLALLDTVIKTAANVRFGPELYCGKKKGDADVLTEFTNRVETMAHDLLLTEGITMGKAVIVEGDSRACNLMRDDLGKDKFSSVICSPPYPCEHDYTRNARLELAFLEEVTDRQTLRTIKKTMVRSHTKGIYVSDNDSHLVKNHIELRALAIEIDERASDKTHGFARLYSKVTTEYFGGMKRHLKNLKPLLKPRATLAYVVGDQSSYFQVPIKTAAILGSLAEEVGYDVLEIRPWRDRQSTGTSKVIVENILLLQVRS